MVLIDVPATAPNADARAPVLFYGHLDKQPEASGWTDAMGPWTPLLKDGKLYGRGAAVDGYAMFGALGAILAVDTQGASRGRCVILIEACEESGSFDLPADIEYLKERLATPSLVICLDTGCGDYEQLWLTSSLRGMVGGSLRVDVLLEGVHSGLASGIVASSFRILRTLLSRLEDEETGEILPVAFHADIPPERVAQAGAAAEALGESVWSKFPFMPGMGPISFDGAQLLLNQSWRPALALTGLDGAPLLGGAGNVLRPFTAAKLSLRLPPTLDAELEQRMYTRAQPLVAKRLEWLYYQPGVDHLGSLLPSCSTSLCRLAQISETVLQPARARCTASGSRSMTVSSTRALVSGPRRPCSQSRTVPRGKPNLAANASWLSPSLSRIARTFSSAGTCTR